VFAFVAGPALSRCRPQDLPRMQVQAHFPHQPLPDFRLYCLAVQAFVLDSRQPCNLKAV
jgi:hypothetical protein